ncbi:MAG: hypothetical protein HQ542_13010, partial [Bacteroidia bacterium]|nr:hypothetical protein [Bacteroidia bacterium]
MNDNPQDFAQQQQAIDYKVILFKFYRYWYFFAITIFIALIIAFVFNKYSKPIYEVKTTVLIKDKSENKLNPQNIMGLGMLNDMQNLQNEIGILSSYSLTYKTILKCGFDVGYYSEENFITQELYKSSPFTVEFDSSFPQPVNIRFNITFLSGTEYRLEVQDEKVRFFDYKAKEPVDGREEAINFDKTLKFGQEIAMPQFKFKTLLNANYNPDENKKRSFFFIFKDYPLLVTEFKSFGIEPINREASIVQLTLKGGNVEKIADFLNTLTSEYLARGLEQKNLVAIRTISFIDHELSGIADSLNLSERSLQSFKASTEIMDLDQTAQQVFDKMMVLQDEKAIIHVNSKYLANLLAYINKSEGLNEIIVPASMGVDNPMLNDLTMQLTGLYNQRTERAFYSTDKNPALKALDLQIESTKYALAENIKSAINTNEIALKDINARIELLNSRISGLPENQRILVGIQRKYKL